MIPSHRPAGDSRNVIAAEFRFGAEALQRHAGRKIVQLFCISGV